MVRRRRRRRSIMMRRMVLIMIRRMVLMMSIDLIHFRISEFYNSLLRAGEFVTT